MTEIHGFSPTSQGHRDPKLMSLANKIEAQFLNEMLKTAGVGKAPSGFGGGVGEDQFTSFLTGAYADATVEAGGIGLSEAIYRSLLAREGMK